MHKPSYMPHVYCHKCEQILTADLFWKSTNLGLFRNIKDNSRSLIFITNNFNMHPVINLKYILLTKDFNLFRFLTLSTWVSLLILFIVINNVMNYTGPKSRHPCMLFCNKTSVFFTKKIIWKLDQLKMKRN